MIAAIVVFLIVTAAASLLTYRYLQGYYKNQGIALFFVCLLMCCSIFAPVITMYFLR